MADLQVHISGPPGSGKTRAVGAILDVAAALGLDVDVHEREPYTSGGGPSAAYVHATGASVYGAGGGAIAFGAGGAGGVSYVDIAGPTYVEPSVTYVADALTPRTPLPTDSAERKAIPLCTGCIDYFPAMLGELIEWLVQEQPISHASADDVLYFLANRDRVQLCCAALDILQQEIAGRWTSCPPNSLVERWPHALAEVARISKAGNDKHNPGEPLHHARGKSMDHPDCIARHALELGGFDGPFRHSACMAWRCLALGQEECEAEGAPLARGARL